VVTASSDKTARVWDAATGHVLTPPMKHGGAVLQAKFSPDGKRVVTASDDKTVRVWDAATGQPVSQAMQHQSRPVYVAFSSDGRRLVTVSHPLTVRHWDAVSGQPLSPPQTPPVVNNRDMLFCVLSPNGRRFVAIPNWDRSKVQVWETSTGQPLTPPVHHIGDVNLAVFSSDGRRVVTTGSDDTVRLWDAATGQPLTPRIQHQGAVWVVSLNSDGSRMVTASEDKIARVLDINADRSADDWVLLTRLFIGKMDKFGGLVPLSTNELKAAWQRLKTKFPHDFTVTPERAMEWHRREAEQCLKEGNGPGYLLHSWHSRWELHALLGSPLLGRW
jgi:WD40 repeat protein